LDWNAFPGITVISNSNSTYLSHLGRGGQERRGEERRGEERRGKERKREWERV